MQIQTCKGAVQAKISQPKLHGKFGEDVGVLLAHGAGGDMNSAGMQLYDRVFHNLGLTCYRYTYKTINLSSRVAVFKDIIEQLSSENYESHKCSKWIFAGHSMGSRVACSVAAMPDYLKAVKINCLGVVAFSYPLHPPGKNTLRESPLLDVQCPILVVRGEKDIFSQEKYFSETVNKSTNPSLKIETIAGAGHGLVSKGKKDIGLEEQLSNAIEQFISEIFEQSQNNSSRKQSSEKRDIADQSQQPKSKRQKN